MTENKFTYPIRKVQLYIIGLEVFLLLISTYLFLLSSELKAFEEDVLSFKNQHLLLLNLLGIAIIFFQIIQLNKINLSRKHFSNSIITNIFQPISFTQFITKYFLFRIAIFFLIIAISQPFYGTKKLKGIAESLELVIALDISNSMNTKDIDNKNTRLNIAKQSIIELINQLRGERLGVSIFAGSAFVQLPLTNDYDVAKMFINEIETSMISDQGTNIKEALLTSQEMFSKLKSSKAVILVTDGENHEENPEDVYNELLDKKVQVCVLGIGTLKGGLIPNNPYHHEYGYKQDDKGQMIVSKVNQHFIKEIASKTNGFAMITENQYPDLNLILEKIKHLKREKVNEINIDTKKSIYPYFVFLSLLSLIVFLLINKIQWKKTAIGAIFIFIASSSLNAQSWQDSVQKSREYYKKGEFEKALKSYESTEKKFKKDLKKVNLKSEKAQTYYKSGNFKEAQKLFHDNTKKGNKQKKSSNYYNEGNAYYQQKEFGNAIQSYKNALKLNPNDKQARYNLSQAIRQLKKSQDDKTKDNKNQDNKTKDNKKQDNKTKDKKNKNDKNQDNKSKDNKKQTNNALNTEVDKILDQLSKQDAQTKRKARVKQGKNSKTYSGKDW